MKDYPYIRAYGLLLGSFQSYIDSEVEKARQTNAPQTAVSQYQDGNWATFEDITFSDTRERIASIVAEMQKENAGEMPPQNCEGTPLSNDKKTKIHISYLGYYASKLSEIADSLSDSKKKYDVTADRDQVEQMKRQLERLQAVLNTLPLA
jgi:predicted transcriptional regulator